MNRNHHANTSLLPNPTVVGKRKYVQLQEKTSEYRISWESMPTITGNSSHGSGSGLRSRSSKAQDPGDHIGAFKAPHPPKATR
jgi:hypothetical protein